MGINDSDGRNIVMGQPLHPKDTIYWVLVENSDGLRKHVKGMTGPPIDYEVMHKHFGHPSQEVLKQAKKHTKNFPPSVEIPKHNPLCHGCAQGKMSREPFPPSEKRAKRKFQKIHSDLKEFSTESYHKYKWFISFLDDCSSRASCVLLCQKNGAAQAIKDFILMVEIQYHEKIKEWQVDGGAKFINKELEDFFKSKGIKLRISAPHMHQQHGRTERFNCTIMEKAEVMCHDTCLPDSYWEFSVLYAIHVYN